MPRKLEPNRFEPDTGDVHAPPPPNADQITFCGMPDQIGITADALLRDTKDAVTCKQCRWYIDHGARLKRARR